MPTNTAKGELPFTNYFETEIIPLKKNGLNINPAYSEHADWTHEHAYALGSYNLI